MDVAEVAVAPGHRARFSSVSGSADKTAPNREERP